MTGGYIPSEYRREMRRRGFIATETARTLRTFGVDCSVRAGQILLDPAAAMQIIGILKERDDRVAQVQGEGPAPTSEPGPSPDEPLFRLPDMDYELREGA